MNKFLFFIALAVLPLFSATAQAAPASGYWWNPAEPGRGFVIEIQGNTMFMAGFLYVSSGEATWVGSTGPMTTATQYSGPLTTYTGGQTLTGAFKPATVVYPAIGTLSINFNSNTAGTLTWPGGTIPIQRFDFGPGGSGATQPLTNPQTGWWWNPAEGGRGFAIEIQSGALYFAAYMYDASGNPLWYLASGNMSNPGLFQGEWAQFGNGQTLTGSYRASSIVNSNAGSVTLAFANDSSATLTLPDGRQIPLTRYMFGGSSGTTISEFGSGISANAAPTGITAGPDGNLWFTEAGVQHNANRIGRITRAGVVTEFSAGITAGASPTGITTGADGDLWFTESGTGRIGRITPAGVVTEFSAGISPGAALAGITAGPDGNLWFTEAGSNTNANQIGRITPSGVVTEFSAGISPGAVLVGITAGPDGNLWFTESAKDRIGRITPQGVVTEFSAGITGGASPYVITAGPDGNLWFTELDGNRIGRITPQGVVTEFSAGISVSAELAFITAGPDGNLWFTEANASRIGRITPAGMVTEFSAGVTAGAVPLGITTGTDGNLWFTEGSGNQIGRISP
jgi:streptogramin lyase